MSAPGNSFSNDPLSQIMNGSTEIFMLTNESMKSIDHSKTGAIGKLGTAGLQVVKITPQMLMKSMKLIQEINLLAHQGYLGFGTANHSKIQFRQDVAEKIGHNRSFDIINEDHPEEVEHIDAEVMGIDDAAYSSLAKTVISVAPTDIDQEEELKEHQEHKAEEPGHKSHPQRETSPAPQHKMAQHKSVRQFAEGMIQQARANEKHRRENAAEKREADAKRERDDIKRDVLKREIKNEEVSKAEIKSGEKRVDQNQGAEIDVSNKRKGVPAMPTEKIKKRKLS